MILVAASIIGLLLAAIATSMSLANQPLFFFGENERDDTPTSGNLESVSVLIPARDEAKGIRDSIEAALASSHVNVEVLVLDDHSSDQTADIVNEIARQDSRVRCLTGKPLPDGWNGKQFACRQLADVATHDRMAFIDADVRLGTNALYRLMQRQDETGVALLSAFPHQQTESMLEKWLIPLMHFILLGFLPLARMRSSVHPAYAAGCGQLFLTDRERYELAGTHAAIRSSRHDGIKLPRAYRESGLMTDVVDGTAVAECRMYEGGGQVIRGVLKNATEGIANPRLIVPFTIMLLGGNVLPWVTLVLAIMTGAKIACVISVSALMLSHAPRADAVRQFRQPISGVIFHAPAVLLFVALQWLALMMHLSGRQIAWRGRVESKPQAASTT